MLLQRLRTRNNTAFRDNRCTNSFERFLRDKRTHRYTRTRIHARVRKHHTNTRAYTGIHTYTYTVNGDCTLVNLYFWKKTKTKQPQERKREREKRVWVNLSRSTLVSRAFEKLGFEIVHFVRTRMYHFLVNTSPQPPSIENQRAPSPASIFSSYCSACEKTYCVCFEFTLKNDFERSPREIFQELLRAEWNGRCV